MTLWMPGDTPPQTARTVLAYVGAGNVATVYYEYKKWVCGQEDMRCLYHLCIGWTY